VHSTPDGRFALVCLLVLAASVALARRSELRPGGSLEPAVRESEPSRVPTRGTGQGDALRDGVGIDPNRASSVELEMLPGVGPSLARQIVTTREANGPFRSIEELRKVRGIGARTLEKLRPFLRLHSEQLEQAADAQRDVVRTADLTALDQHAGAHVDAERQLAREQVVGTEHEVAHGQEGDAGIALLRDE
jgi:competence ComEA-like helix-hairpin-helix protein